MEFLTPDVLFSHPSHQPSYCPLVSKEVICLPAPPLPENCQQKQGFKHSQTGTHTNTPKSPLPTKFLIRKDWSPCCILNCTTRHPLGEDSDGTFPRFPGKKKTKPGSCEITSIICFLNRWQTSLILHYLLLLDCTAYFWVSQLVFWGKLLICALISFLKLPPWAILANFKLSYTNKSNRNKKYLNKAAQE